MGVLELLVRKGTGDIRVARSHVAVGMRLRTTEYAEWHEKEMGAEVGRGLGFVQIVARLSEA